MPKITPQMVAKRLEEARKELEAAERKAAPARKAYDDFVTKTLQPAEAKAKELGAAKREAEKEIAELNNEIAMHTRSIGGRSMSNPQSAPAAVAENTAPKS